MTRPVLTFGEVRRKARLAADRLRPFDRALSGTELPRGRPRSAEEWDWLRRRGVSEARLGPRWEGPGPPPRLPDDREE